MKLNSLNGGSLPMLAAALCLAASLTCGAESGHQPNFVIFLADDLGWADVGFHGSKIKTPNLDRLAAEGLLLEQHYVAPVCSPTRTGLMSGRFWSRFGVTGPQNEQAMPFGTETLASALKSLGYQTGLFGKWHLGSLPEQGPQKFGFDRSYGSLAGGVLTIITTRKALSHAPGTAMANWSRRRATSPI